jgi:hypothetical protein
MKARRRTRGSPRGCTTVGVLFVVLIGCTPTRSTLPQPFPYKGTLVSEGDLRTIATQQCVAANPGRRLPDHPFTTDGCSGWPNSSWTECCVAHDTLYWCGGTARARLAADRELRDCVQRHSNPLNARLMFLGVRAGGSHISILPWRWGYGYDWGRAPEDPTAKPAN